MSQTPADIARTALRSLAELGLPPTPEHFSQQYYRVSGEEAPDPCAELSREIAANAELVELVRSLLETVTVKTSGLVENLGTQNQDLKQSVDTLGKTGDRKKMLELLAAIVRSAGNIQQSVETTHEELVETRHSLDDLRSELEESRRLMHEDFLTGAQNRRGMDVVLAAEIAKARRSGAKLSVAMLDIDHFKQVNDTYGHEAGDAVLLHLAALAKSVLREADVLVRYGGEEFLLILPESTLSGAEFVLGRLMQVVQKSPLTVGERKIEITFSSGIAQFQTTESAHELVGRADMALYAAKRAGRNCIRIAD